jgi:pyroglutamyl-peptidase
VTLLVTAFEPFGPWARNTTAEVAQRLAAEIAGPVSVRVLPVDLQTAPEVLRSALRSLQPSAVLLLGLHGRARAVRVERAALNVADFAVADNAGRTVRAQPVVPGAPQGRLCSLDVRDLVDRMRAQGVPADVSNSAGTYLCNAAYFVALDVLDGGAPCVFLHLPPAPGDAATAAQRQADQRSRGEEPAPVDPRLTGEDGGVDPAAALLLDLQVRGARVAAEALLEASRPPTGAVRG